MQEFDIEVRKQAGMLMTHLYALGRSPTKDSTDTMNDIITKRLEVFVTMTKEQYVRGMQRCDTEILDLIKTLK